MSAVDRLERYLDALRRRLLQRIGARAALGVAAIALLATLIVALLLHRFDLSDAWLRTARLLLIALSLGVLAALAWWPLRRLLLRDGAAVFEQQLPEQDGRIETYLELRRRARGGDTSPFIEMLAEDAAGIAERSTLDARLPHRAVWLPAAGCVVVVVLLGGLLSVGQNYWTTGARTFWLGTLAPGTLPAAQRRIDVWPGDSSVRRNQDVTITAKTVGFAARDAEVHVRFADSKDWENAPMQDRATNALAFTLYALREPAAYYVTAGGLRSGEHRLKVVDPPRIQKLRLTYVYPDWTGLKPHTQDDGGDIQAVAGTQVRIEVRTDAPLDGPLLIVDEKGQPLSQQGLVSRGQISVQEPGQYRISTRFAGELVALTDNFHIAITPDEKPTVAIQRPGRDYQASSIEEVPVAVRAHDDFRLESLELHYTVNGGEWRTEKLNPAASDINDAALLRLEEMRESATAPLQPGDIVSYYAIARDHRQSAQTDLFLIQVQPFDRRYTQSQAMGGGGGGGGGDNEGQISQRQREILMATFNLVRDADERGRESARVNDNAALLTELQKTLADQANKLVERAGARQLTGTEDTITQFVKQLQEAAQAMQPAAEHLSKLELQPAISDEQRALAHLLRAESSMRDIQVAMQSGNRGGGGGGGGGGQAGRDIAEMTELELDLEKNQYETESRPSAEASDDSENENVRRLRELARRQEQLARQQAQRTQTPEAQRWQQEQLRREAEDLRRQLEQQARQQSGQSGQPSQGQPSGSQQGGTQSSSGSSAVAQALTQVEQAIEAMRQGRPGAQQSLERARQLLEQGKQQALSERFDNLARDASQLIAGQQRSEEDLRSAVAGGRRLSEGQADEMSKSKRAIQSQLERLQQQMQAAQQQEGKRAPDAAALVSSAARKLDEDGTAASLARSAMEIERGVGGQAVARDSVITESLRDLQQGLDEAARSAATEAGRAGGKQAARPADLLAELGELRRALQQAQQQSAQAQAGQGQVGQAQVGQAQLGQAQAGQSPGGGGNVGGVNNLRGGANIGGGNLRGGYGGYGGPIRGGYAGGTRWLGGPLLIEQARDSAQRLQDLIDRLLPGALSGADVGALRELAGRLRRAGGDPMSAEYQHMQALLDQLELAALKAAAESAHEPQARAETRSDEPARYRDRIAEYYRRLGSP